MITSFSRFVRFLDLSHYMTKAQRTPRYGFSPYPQSVLPQRYWKTKNYKPEVNIVVYPQYMNSSAMEAVGL